MIKIHITSEMLCNGIEIVSLENTINNHGTTLKEAMEQKAEKDNMQLKENFWDNHEPLAVVRDSLLDKEINAYYKNKVGNKSEKAKEYIHGFINNKNNKNHFNFFFHTKTNSANHASSTLILDTLIANTGNIDDFLDFVNKNVGD